MRHIGIIGGTGSSLGLTWESPISAKSPFGGVAYMQATFVSDIPTSDTLNEPVRVTYILRHVEEQQQLSNMVNHRANVWTLHELGVDAIVATTSCGVIDPLVPLATPMVFDELFFPDNRLPSGEACTFFSTPGEVGRGHLIAPQHFSPVVSEVVRVSAKHISVDVVFGGTYSYALGPRFNSKSEIKLMASVGCSMVSQTAGPEAILAAELEIPYALVGFGTDYANGVAAQPTPVETLNENLALGKEIFNALVLETISTLAHKESPTFDTGFVYRFS